MREFTLVEFTTNEAINLINEPVEVLMTGVLLNEVSETHGLYSVPATRLVREIEVEYAI